jgi:hypothetical protein
MSLCQHEQRQKVIKWSKVLGGNKVAISMWSSNTGFNVSYPEVFQSFLSSEVNNGISRYRS